MLVKQQHGKYVLFRDYERLTAERDKLRERVMYLEAEIATLRLPKLTEYAPLMRGENP